MPVRARVVQPAIAELLEIQSLDAFLDLLARRPELFSETTRSELLELEETFGYGPTFTRFITLLDDARIEPENGWRGYETDVEQLEPLQRRLDALASDLQTAARGEDFDRVIEIADEAVPLAAAAGFGMPVSWFLDKRGMALFSRNGERRADDLEEAGQTLELAAQLAAPGEQLASTLMHYGLVFGERVRGDRAENIERSIEVLEEGLRQLADSDDLALRAMLQTNLAVALNRCERPDQSAVRHAAAQMCRRALEYRSPDRDVDDWALTMVNLGDALYGLFELGELQPDEATAAFSAVIAKEHQLSGRHVAGSARHLLGRMQIHAAARLDDEREGEPNEGPVGEALLQAAFAHLTRAEQLLRDGPDPLRHGVVLSDLGQVLIKLDKEDDAAACLRQALVLLRPDNSPYRCAEAATRLGNLLSSRGEWAPAAAAFGDALDATETTFHGRLETASREAELERNKNLHRRAAYAFARAGELLVAVEILEAGRARELRRRIAIPSLDELDGVPQGLRAQYAAAAEELLTAPIGKDGSVAARRFQEVLTSVRAQAGRPEFAAVVRAEEVAQAIEPGWPLVYLNPSPHGTLILLVTRGVDDRAMVEATFLDITGMQVMLRLLAGDAADLDDPTQAHNIASYLGGISGTRTVEKDFKKDLDETLPWFGEHLARPIRDLLVSEEPKGVTLIPCGPVAVLPLHACSWVEHHERHCLVDDFEVRYAPSAIVHRAARERATAAESTTPFLVALGNPKGDLAAAGPEVEEIAAQFGTGNSRYAIGSAADPEVLRAHASQATHLHFACHARGGVFDASETAIELASGWLPATAFPAFGGISTRLVVVSACQSALPEIAKLPDEAFSIGTVMLAAGSACVIASLWEVDDLSTSLLMTRLYEEMLGAGQQPPAALRRAQLWLRDLTEQAEHAYLHLHPSLNHEYRRRRLRGDAPGKRGSAAPNGAEIRPYSHPDYWAPFIAVGV